MNIFTTGIRQTTGRNDNSPLGQLTTRTPCHKEHCNSLQGQLTAKIHNYKGGLAIPMQPQIGGDFTCGELSAGLGHLACTLIVL